MRTGIVLVGFGIILFGLLLWIGIGFPIELTGTIGLFNIMIGIVTPRNTGLELQPEQMGPVKLVVDQRGPSPPSTSSSLQTANS